MYQRELLGSSFHCRVSSAALIKAVVVGQPNKRPVKKGCSWRLLPVHCHSLSFASIYEDKRLRRVFNSWTLTPKELLLLFRRSCHRHRSVALAEQIRAVTHDRHTDFFMIRKDSRPHHLRGRVSPPLMGGRLF